MALNARARGIFLIVVLLLAPTQQVSAASCAPDPSLQKLSPTERVVRAAKAPGVTSFVGTALRQRPGSNPSPSTITEFQVELPIQDTTQSNEAVVTAGGRSRGGTVTMIAGTPDFRPGTRYIAIGRRNGTGAVEIGVCTETREIRPGEYAAIADALLIGETQSRTPVALLVLGALGFLALAVFVFRAWKLG